MITALSRGRIRIGFEGETAGAYDVAVKHPDRLLHIVRETSLLLTPLGIEAIGERADQEEEHLHVDLTKVEVEPDDAMTDVEHPLVIVNISGSGPGKFWGKENYVQLMERLHQLGLHPVVAGSPGDAGLVGTIAERSNSIALGATGSFAEFATRLAQADMIITPDTSIVHLAAALRKPTIMLVASELDFIPWSPWGTPHRVVRHKNRIQDIAVESVASAVESLAAETIQATQSSPRA
jgi:ADP-heptose:LPS heptosyltransferase